jgi:hypothetical protein
MDELFLLPLCPVALLVKRLHNLLHQFKSDHGSLYESHKIADKCVIYLSSFLSAKQDQPGLSSSVDSHYPDVKAKSASWLGLARRSPPKDRPVLAIE